MKTKTIVFDLDDTIVKEIEYLKSAFQEIATFVRSILFADYTRVRDEGQKITMSTKIHASHGGNIADQKESCLEIGSFEKAVALLESLGLHQRAFQENQREVWSLDGVHIQIDTWPGMPSYVEIEGVDQAGVSSIASKLNFDKAIQEGKLKSTVASVSHLYSEYFDIEPQTMLSEPTISFAKLPKWASLKD